MRAKEDFNIGDLVWAKMKGFPFWPAKIVKPPTDAKSTPKKAHCYVFFFGSENYAWIKDENIVHHSEKMLKSTSSKKKSTHLIMAIEKITEEATKQVNLPLKERESPEKSPEISASGHEKKIAKVQRMKTESQKVRKKGASKRSATDESADESTSPPQKLCKVSSEGFSGLIQNRPPNSKKGRIAIIRPLEQPRAPPATTSDTPSKVPSSDRFQHLPVPAVDLYEPNEAIRQKNVKASHEKIGFIGLGMMGQRFVKNLLTSNHRITVWNRTPQKCVDFANIGAEVAETPSDVVEKCDIIFCCVSGPEASKHLVFGKDGILTGLEKSPPGSKSYVEMTTLDPTTSIDIAKAVTDRGGKYLEAPFNGSRKSAEDGSLLILSAGNKEVFVACESCFFALSKNAYFLGPDVGSGSKMNLIQNLLIGVSTAGLAEAMTLIKGCSLSQTNFIEIMQFLPSCCNVLMEKGEAMLSRSFTDINNTLAYQQRDMSLALRLDGLAERCQPMQVSVAANEVFKRAKLLNYSGHDVSAVYKGAEY